MAWAIVTREEGAAASYGHVLARLGLETVALQVTRTEPIGDHALSRALCRTSYWAIAIASAKAAEALIDAWNNPVTIDDTTSPEVDLRGRALLPAVWAVGAATGRVLLEAGIAPIVDPPVRDAASLASAMVARGVRLRRILIPRAVEGRRELIDALEANGAEVDAIDVYRTVALPIAEVAERDKLADAAVVCVFAPSQVAALDAIVGMGHLRCPVVAIGDTTAAAARQAGASHVVVAAEPTPEGLAKAVATVYPPKP